MERIEGQIIEFTLDGIRRTAEVMLQAGDEVLLDFYDGERPVLTRIERLVDLEVFHPEEEILAA